MTLTIPNQITLARILAIPLLMYFIFAEGTVFKILAIVLFALAAASDVADGYLARSLRQETPFGVFADPIADKLLVTAALVSFVELGELAAVPVVVILAREFLVTGLRLVAVGEGVVISASYLGKVKTASHTGLVLFILAVRYFGVGPWGDVLREVFLYLAVALAVVSGGEYFWRGRRLLINPLVNRPPPRD
ncbi:MAG: CDP-diacylglycerol--glycerol-3-phosphate 3-phosphatidyltransferase [Candidatus Bipolaricaulota bacterium]